MSTRKMICVTLALMMSFSIPLLALAEPQGAQIHAREDENTGEAFLAGFLTAINIPSRLVLCGLDAGMGAIVMAASAGRRKDYAAEIIREGCTGPWVITPEEASIETKENDLPERYQAALEESKRLRRDAEQEEREIARLNSIHNELVRSLKQEIEEGNAKIARYESLLTVQLVATILFDSGKAEITPEGVEILKRVGDILKNAKDKEIRVEGHTDNVPIGRALTKKFSTNWELSTARATAVVRYLRDHVGIPSARLSATGLSKYRPVAPNTSPPGRAQNRRIEIILAPISLASVPR